MDAKMTVAGRQYTTAHAVHYGTKNLREALGLYMGVIAAHPGSQEAGYSHSQIHNIIKSVVPEEILLEAQVNLALAHCVGGD